MCGDAFVGRLKDDATDPEPRNNFDHLGYVGGDGEDGAYWMVGSPAGDADRDGDRLRRGDARRHVHGGGVLVGVPARGMARRTTGVRHRTVTPETRIAPRRRGPAPAPGYSQGFSRRSPATAKSDTLRVTSTILWCEAVAAISESMTPSGVP